MFSFVDIRLALLLSATVLLARGQGEDDSKYDFQTLFWIHGTGTLWELDIARGCFALRILCSGDYQIAALCDTWLQIVGKLDKAYALQSETMILITLEMPIIIVDWSANMIEHVSGSHLDAQPVRPLLTRICIPSGKGNCGICKLGCTRR